MQAINYFIVIRKIKEAPKKVGGLELTEDQNKEVRYLKAEVVSVGDKVQGIEPGNIIRYDKHAGHGMCRRFYTDPCLRANGCARPGTGGSFSAAF